MKKWALFILGIGLIVTQGISIYMTAQVYSKLSNNTSPQEEVQDIIN